jgi:hypothetical protein
VKTEAVKPLARLHGFVNYMTKIQSFFSIKFSFLTRTVFHKKMAILDGLYGAMSVLFFLAPATTVLIIERGGSGFLRNFAKSDFIDLLKC